MAKTRDALKIIDRITGDDVALRALIEAATTSKLERGQHLFSYTG
jgi:hypothetical protein